MNENNEKNFSKITIVIIILMAIIIGMMIYIIFISKDIKLNTENKASNNNSSGEIQKDEYALPSEKTIDDLINKYGIEKDDIEGDAFPYNAFDSVDTMSLDAIGSNMYFYAKLDNVSEVKNTLIPSSNQRDSFSVISKNDYDAIFKKYFGIDVEVKGSKVSDFNKLSGQCNGYVLVEKYNNYYAGLACGGQTPPRKDYVVNKKAIDSNTIVVDKKYYYYSDTTNTIFIDRTNGKKVKESMDVSKKEFLDKYSEYFNTIEYTFKRQSDGNYYIDSVKNLKDAKEYK